MREPRTLQIEMNPPRNRTTVHVPFTDADLEALSRGCGEHMASMTCGDIIVDEVMALWELVDGYLIYRPEVGAIRIGRGTVDGGPAWWVDVRDDLSPCIGKSVSGWRYQAHFPGTFTPEWVNWIYWQWIE